MQELLGHKTVAMTVHEAEPGRSLRALRRIKAALQVTTSLIFRVLSSQKSQAQCKPLICTSSE